MNGTQFGDLLALGFQGLVTVSLALVHFALWRQGRGRAHAIWGLAWSFYALRLLFISQYIVDRREVWLFAHQTATGLTALALLWAALQFSQGARWRPAYALLPALATLWAWFSVFRMHNMAVAGASGAVLLSAVTLWTGVVFGRLYARGRNRAALMLAVTFVLWGLHHLDYPLLRRQGEAVLLGVFVDVLLIMAVAMGLLALTVGEERRALAARNAQLEQLTRLLLSAQEDERRRIARALHDQAGQALTAVKIELDLEGRHDASARVGQVLNQVRDVSNLLRPPVLDDLGLEPALRAMVDDFTQRTRVEAEFDVALGDTADSPAAQVAIYRMVQEALTNVARHADATRVSVRVRREQDGLTIAIADNGRGAAAAPAPHLGLLGMNERIAELGGTLEIETRPAAGFRLTARLPVPMGGMG